MQLCTARACKRVVRAGLVATGLTITLRIDARSVSLKAGARDATADPETWLAIAAALLETAPPAPITGLRVTLTGLHPESEIAPTLF
jgi:DNA polymerase IV